MEARRPWCPTPPVGAPDRSLWWESDTGNLYIRYNDGTSTQWVLVMPQASAAAISAVTYTAQTLSAPQQVQARSNIYAAPFDAMAYNGMQVNGSCEVSQELGTAAGASSSGSETPVCDVWRYNFANGPIGFGQQVADAPPGFANSIKLTTTTGGAAGIVYMYHKIEGYRMSRLAFGNAAAQPVTLCFWVKTHRPGTYSGTLQNSGNARSYPFLFVINAADTWEYKTVTIPGDVTGTWLKDNGVRPLCILSATTITAPAGAWVAGNFVGAAGTINGAAATSDTFQITGLVVSRHRSPIRRALPFIMRPYDQKELLLCMRHWERGEF